MLAVLLGCGLRRSELIGLTFDHMQRREDHWTIVDLIGKAGHVSWCGGGYNARGHLPCSGGRWHLLTPYTEARECKKNSRRRAIQKH